MNIERLRSLARVRKAQPSHDELLPHLDSKRTNELIRRAEEHITELFPNPLITDRTLDDRTQSWALNWETEMPTFATDNPEFGGRRIEYITLSRDNDKSEPNVEVHISFDQFESAGFQYENGSTVFTKESRKASGELVRIRQNAFSLPLNEYNLHGMLEVLEFFKAEKQARIGSY